MSKPVKQRLKNWWLHRITMFKVEVDVCILSIRAEVVILDCKLGGELELSQIMHWLLRVLPEWEPRTWKRQIGKYKVLEAELVYDTCFSTGFSFAWYAHCDRNGYRLGLDFLGLSSILTYRDLRHWDWFKGSYEAREEK